MIMSNLKILSWKVAKLSPNKPLLAYPAKYKGDWFNVTRCMQLNNTKDV